MIKTDYNVFVFEPLYLQPVVAAVTPVVDHRSLPNSEPARLRLTGNEIRATDIKFQTSADSIRNYATEGLFSYILIGSHMFFAIYIKVSSLC